MAMATPGNVSEMSRRTRATEPTAPVASAPSKSRSLGWTRPATSEFVWAMTSFTTTKPTSHPMAIAVVRRLRQGGANGSGSTDRRARPRAWCRGSGSSGGDDHGPYDGRRGVRGDAGRGDDRRQHDKDPEPARPLTGVWPFEEHRVAHVLHVVHFCGSRTEIAGAKATVRNVAVPLLGRRPRARSRARP